MRQVCRLCLCSLKDSERRDPFAGQECTLASKILICLDITVTTDDPLPKNVCNVCATQVESFYFFRVRCREANAIVERDFSIKKIQVPKQLDSSPVLRVKSDAVLRNLKQESHEASNCRAERERNQSHQDVSVTDLLHQVLAKEKANMPELIQKVITPDVLVKLNTRGFNKDKLVEMVTRVKNESADNTSSSRDIALALLQNNENLKTISNTSSQIKAKPLSLEESVAKPQPTKVEQMKSKNYTPNNKNVKAKPKKRKVNDKPCHQKVVIPSTPKEAPEINPEINPEYPYVCNICDKSFKRKVQLDAHSKTHFKKVDDKAGTSDEDLSSDSGDNYDPGVVALSDSSDAEQVQVLPPPTTHLKKNENTTAKSAGSNPFSGVSVDQVQNMLIASGSTVTSAGIFPPPLQSNVPSAQVVSRRSGAVTSTITAPANTQTGAGLNFFLVSTPQSNVSQLPIPTLLQSSVPVPFSNVAIGAPLRVGMQSTTPCVVSSAMAQGSMTPMVTSQAVTSLPTYEQLQLQSPSGVPGTQIPVTSSLLRGTPLQKPSDSQRSILIKQLEMPPANCSNVGSNGVQVASIVPTPDPAQRNVPVSSAQTGTTSASSSNVTTSTDASQSTKDQLSQYLSLLKMLNSIKSSKDVNLDLPSMLSKSQSPPVKDATGGGNSTSKRIQDIMKKMQTLAALYVERGKQLKGANANAAPELIDLEDDVSSTTVRQKNITGSGSSTTTPAVVDLSDESEDNREKSSTNSKESEQGLLTSSPEPVSENVETNSATVAASQKTMRTAEATNNTQTESSKVSSEPAPPKTVEIIREESEALPAEDNGVCLDLDVTEEEASEPHMTDGCGDVTTDGETNKEDQLLGMCVEDEPAEEHARVEEHMVVESTPYEENDEPSEQLEDPLQDNVEKIVPDEIRDVGLMTETSEKEDLS